MSGNEREIRFRLPTFGRLHRYLAGVRRRGEVPRSDSIVCSLLPWAERDRYSEFFRWG